MDEICFPPGQAANVVRGTLGRILHNRHAGAYARIFAPKATTGSGPSGLLDPPRPFVLRVSHLDGVTIRPGCTFEATVHVFDSSLADFNAIFAAVAQEGIGPSRARASIERAESEHIELSLRPGNDPITRIQVDFVTPMELKDIGKLVKRPEFPILFRRIRDRISALRAIYGDGPLEVDFQALGERAEAITMERCEIQVVKAERRSGRTGQIHSIGGFVGTALYRGDLKEFLPYLQAAQWTGVGRQTVWGKGEIRYTSGA